MAAKRSLHLSLSVSEALSTLEVVSHLVVHIPIGASIGPSTPFSLFNDSRIQIHAPNLHVNSDGYGAKGDKVGVIGDEVGGVG